MDGGEFESYAAAASFAARPLGDVVAGDWTTRSVRAIAYAMAGHELHPLADFRRQHGLQPGGLDSRKMGEV